MENTKRSLFFASLLSAWFTQKEVASLLRFESEEAVLEHFQKYEHARFGVIQEYFESKQHEINTSLLQELDVKILLSDDAEYPESLREISNTPSVVFVRGNLRKDLPLLWVVWPRKPSLYGQEITRRFVPDFVRANFGIVSGGAFGIDALAHEVALQNSGYTIAVIGTGIDISYPRYNKKMYEEIIAKWGAILSIFPPGTPPLPYNFPLRNEIVVWLSSGIFAPEASERSGTLITTALALDFWKEVFTVPADIYRATSLGTNKLIRDGLAKPCLTSEDVLVEFWIMKHSGANQLPLASSEEESLILLALQKERFLSLEQILEYTSLDSSVAISTLTLLEISQIIQNTHGKYHFR